MSHPADTVTQRAIVFQHLPHRSPDFAHAHARSCRGKTGIYRLVNSRVGTTGIVSYVAKAEVAVKITKVAIEYRAGIDNQHIAILGGPLRGAHDNAVVASRTGSGNHKGRIICTAFKQIDSQPSGDLDFGVTELGMIWQRFEGARGNLADLTDFFYLGG